MIFQSMLILVETILIRIPPAPRTKGSGKTTLPTHKDPRKSCSRTINNNPPILTTVNLFVGEEEEEEDNTNQTEDSQALQKEVTTIPRLRAVEVSHFIAMQHGRLVL